MGEYSYLTNGLAPTNLREDQTSLDCIFSFAAAGAPFTAQGQEQPEPQYFLNYTPAIENTENINNTNDAADISLILEDILVATEAATTVSPAPTPPPPPPEAAAGPPPSPLPQPQPEHARPNANNPAVVLETLRSQIPASILATYSAPLAVGPEAAAAQQRSTLYHAELARQKTIVRAKADIKAVKELQSKYPDWPVWPRQHGHPAGIKPGEAFSGRGELWLTGAHQQYFRGIDSAGKAPAYAIVLSGEYEDDDDHGDYLHYTGEGGRDTAKGGVRQAKDQSFESSGNAALKRNFEQGLPIRVMRGAKSPEGEISYTYDGLYCVTSAELVPGISGCLVCKFAMVGIPGHYKACRKVTFLAVRGFKSIQLASRDGTEVGGQRRAPKRQARASKSQNQAASAASAASAPKRKRNSNAKSEVSSLTREEYIAQLRNRKGFLIEDISVGVESWPIPVFNETGDGAMVPTDLHYIKESKVFDSKGAKIIADAALQVMPEKGRWCGIQRAAQHPKYLWNSYNADGFLLATNAFGVWECCDGEACCAASGSGGRKRTDACDGNRVATSGIGRLPLEMFRTIGRGWGVRCMQTIYPGQIVATYEGELVTNAEAELRRDHQSYLFDLDHFLIIRADPTTTEEEHAALSPVPDCAMMHITPGATGTALPLDAAVDDTTASTSANADLLSDFMESPEAPHLVLDARTRGNVGRFFNHSCCPNLMVQPVLTQGCSALRYRVAFVAVKEVQPGLELCYNYGQRYFFKEGGQVVPCACGAENCQGVLGE